MAAARASIGFDRWTQNLPIRRKLMLIAMAATVVALLIAGVGIVVSDSVLFRDYVRRDLRTLAQIIGDNSTAALDFDDPRVASETVGALRARDHVVAACIYRLNGSMLAKYVRAAQQPGCPASLTGQRPQAASTDEIYSQDSALQISHPILLQGRRVGTLYILYDLGEAYQRIKLYGVMVIAVMLAAGFISLLLSSALSSVIAKPISSLVRAASSISQTRDYSIRAPRLTNDETSVLVDAFNDMLSGIQSRDADLRGALQALREALNSAQNARDSLETTLSSIGDAVISTDVAGRIVLVNPAAQALFGRPGGDMKGRPLDEICEMVSEFSREKLESPVARILREGTVAGLPGHPVVIANDRTETPVDFSGAPIRDKDGVIHGTVLIFRDVSGKRRADATSQLLASIVQSSDDAIIGQTIDGIVTSWNQGAERIFGYSAAEMIGNSSSVLAPAGHDEMPGVLARIANGERVEQYLALRRTRSAKIIHVSIAVSPLYDALGRIVGSSKIARDVTDQVRATERLAQLNADLKETNNRLARSNEDLERFAFVASHDLQEPLRMISVYSQLLVRGYDGALDGKAREYIGHILGGAERMRILLSDLLAYAEAGARQEQPAEEVDLNKVVEKARQNLMVAIGECGATITIENLPILQAHEGHFVPLFQNLIGNALKYRGQDDPRVHIAVREVDGDLQFSVRDNGIGIAPEFHHKIFVPFKRLHGKQIPGTGIGLAICQRVVEGYGGRIWVESQEGKGATFLFTLPATLRMIEEKQHGTASW